MMTRVLSMSGNKKTIIGFSGRMMSGKDVLSTAMKETYGSEIITVADALKRLVCKMLPGIFPSIPELNYLKRVNGLEPIPIKNEDVVFISEQTNIPYRFIKEKCDGKKVWKSVRDILQFIGTELIRAYNPNWHVEKLKENILSSKTDFVCVDDIRFPNERAAIEELGGENFFIIRPQSEVVSNHESETSLRWQDFGPSHIILNEGSEETLKENFTVLFETPFRCFSESPILLSGNEYYMKDNANFGFNADEYETKLIEKILEQNKDSEMFRKHGVVSYYTTDFSERVRFANRVIGSSRGVEYCRNKFVFYNPLIYENLKFYL